MKLFKIVILSGFLLLTNFSLAFGEVNISAEESIVGNLIYEIRENGEPCLEDGSLISLKNSRDIVIDEEKTVNSTIIFENVPFGNYTLDYNNGELTYDVTVDKEYLETQHIVKIINIEEEKEKLDYLNNKNNLPSTGVESNRIGIAFILIIVGIALFSKRKEVM